MTRAAHLINCLGALVVLFGRVGLRVGCWNACNGCQPGAPRLANVVGPFLGAFRPLGSLGHLCAPLGVALDSLSVLPTVAKLGPPRLANVVGSFSWAPVGPRQVPWASWGCLGVPGGQTMWLMQVLSIRCIFVRSLGLCLLAFEASFCVVVGLLGSPLGAGWQKNTANARPFYQPYLFLLFGSSSVALFCFFWRFGCPFLILLAFRLFFLVLLWALGGQRNTANADPFY